MALFKPRVNLSTHVLRYYGLLAGVYTLLIVLLPANRQSLHQYHLMPLEYHVLLFAIVLPSLAVWFAAFYGYARLYEYARSLANTPESGDFERLAKGCAWLAWSLPVPAIVALSLGAIANAHPGFLPTTIIVTNYINLLMPLIAFSIVGLASRGLVRHGKVRFSLSSARGIILLFVVAGVAYCYLTFRQFDPASLGSTDNPYYLPIWLMVLTVIIPYLYAWFMGLLAAYEIVSFSKQVRGLLYRQSLGLLAVGLVIVIISFIALQYIGSVQPRMGRLVLDYRLVVNSLFRIIGGVGYVLIALGAIRLKKIEEV